MTRERTKLIWRVCGASLTAVVALVAVLLLSKWAACASNEDASSWFGAIGTVLAIIAAVIIAYFQARSVEDQKRVDRARLGEAAYKVAHEALALVTNRLEVAISPNQAGSQLELRELRTGETLAALRAIAPETIPSDLLPDFVEVRSCVAAIHAELSRLYETKRHIDHPDLVSSVRVHRRATVSFGKFRNLLNANHGIDEKAFATPMSIANFAGSSRRPPKRATSNRKSPASQSMP